MKKYVISIICEYRYNDKKWKRQERFVGLDNYSGSYSTGDPCWISFLYRSCQFDSIEDAKNNFLDWKEYLIDKYLINPHYKLNMDSLCIKEISLKPVYSFSLTKNKSGRDHYNNG